MGKYCILPINYKIGESDNYIVRCILLKYKIKIKKKASKYFSSRLGQNRIEYYNTKLLGADNYFLESGHSHIYLFLKNKYKTKKASSLMSDKIKDRRYHRYPEHAIKEIRGEEFEAKTINEAIRYFKEYISKLGGSCFEYTGLY